MIGSRSVLAPFFIIGSPRSGTTMLRLMLTNHPRLVVPPECGFLMWLYPVFGSWEGADFANAANAARFAASVAAARKFETWALATDDIASAIIQSQACSYSEACHAVYQLFANRAGKPKAIWGDKNNYYLKHISVLKAIYPGARFLHIVRDGRDVACSYREVVALGSNSPYRPALPSSIDEIAKQWSSDVRTIRTHFAALSVADICEVRYEDLTADPTSELARICDWLGIHFAQDMLQFHIANQNNHLEPSATMDWKRRTLLPVSQDTVGRYAKMLSVGETAEFCAIAGAELRCYRYLP